MNWTQEQLREMTMGERHDIVLRFADGPGQVEGAQTWKMTDTSEFRRREGETLEDVVARMKRDRGDYYIAVEVYAEDYKDDMPESFEGIAVKVRLVSYRIIVA